MSGLLSATDRKRRLTLERLQIKQILTLSEAELLYTPRIMNMLRREGLPYIPVKRIMNFRRRDIEKYLDLLPTETDNKTLRYVLNKHN